MFKSIFSKYITVFMLIIVISFVALVGIITSTVNRYSESAKSGLVEGTARSVALYLENRLSHTGLSDFSSYIILNEPDIRAVMRVITRQLKRHHNTCHRYRRKHNILYRQRSVAGEHRC